MTTTDTYNTTIEQGATWERTITWKDENGNLVNLTGYTAKMQVRRSKSDPTVLLELSTSNGRITLGGVAGTIDLLVSASDAKDLAWVGDAVYDLELTSGAGKVTRLLEGKLTLSGDVTR